MTEMKGTANTGCVSQQSHQLQTLAATGSKMLKLLVSPSTKWEQCYVFGPFQQQEKHFARFQGATETRTVRCPLAMSGQVEKGKRPAMQMMGKTYSTPKGQKARPTR